MPFTRYPLIKHESLKTESHIFSARPCIFENQREIMTKYCQCSHDVV